MTSTVQLHSLLRLLDDDTPAVRQSIANELLAYGGDLSEIITEHPRGLKPDELELLSQLLHPARRQALRRDWVAPMGGWVAMEDDWEQLEGSLRLISDFLHDGVSLRASLSDALDMLAEEAAPAVEADGVNGLRMFLFESGQFKGNHANYGDPRNSDLVWVMESGLSNPIGLATLFLLLARRHDLVVEGVNFPGHFLCRIDMDGQSMLVDCFNGGRLHRMAELMQRHEDMSADLFHSLRQSATPGEILLRTLRNLAIAFQRANATEDEALIQVLIESLRP